MSSYLIEEIAYNPRIRSCPAPRSTTRAGRSPRVAARARHPQWGHAGAHLRGLFLLLGAEPHCDWLPEALARDARGFVLTGRDSPGGLGRRSLRPLATSTVPGVFAAGDIRAGAMKRVAAATGEGPRGPPGARLARPDRAPSRLTAPRLSTERVGRLGRSATVATLLPDRRRACRLVPDRGTSLRR